MSEKIDACALASIAAAFFVLALTPIGVRWEDARHGAHLLVRRAESHSVDSLDRWMAVLRAIVGFAVIGLSPTWQVQFPGVLSVAIVRLESGLAFERFDDVAQAVGFR